MAMAATLAPYTVIVPARFGEARGGEARPSSQVFVRRRLMVSLVFVSVVVALWVGAGSVLANRGGAPASTSAVRPATSYVVQPGDTLWSIAERFHGASSQVGYVDALVGAIGDAALQVGQVIVLP
jgi:LysM repeat protein